MLIIAMTTGFQTVVMNGNMAETYDSVVVGTRNINVLSRWLKTASDGADATWRGRSFRRWHQKPETPLADCTETNGQNVQTMWGVMDGSIRDNCQFVGDTFWDAKPAKADERCGNMFWVLTVEFWKLATAFWTDWRR